MQYNGLSNPERKSAEKQKSNIFTYVAGAESHVFSENELGEADLLFNVDREIFRGHQLVFINASQKLRNCFEQLNAESGSATQTSVNIDSSVEVFESVFNFCYNKKLSVPINLVPSVYTLAKNLEIKELQKICSDYICRHLSGKNIGEICSMIVLKPLTKSESNGYHSSHSDEAEDNLRKSVLSYIESNAASIACSLTGQLGARLIVNLTGYPGLDHSISQDERPSFVSDDVALAVLLWADRRISSGVRLAQSGCDENVQSDDEQADNVAEDVKGTAVYGRGARRNPTNLISRLERLSKSPSRAARGACLSPVNGHIRTFEPTEVERTKEKSEPTIHGLLTQDVRITLDYAEIRGMLSSSTPSQDRENLNGSLFPGSICQSDEPETETCLLSGTDLGVGATSIWLGKLAGHLVSLSIKVCAPRVQSSASTPNSDNPMWRPSNDERESGESSPLNVPDQLNYTFNTDETTSSAPTYVTAIEEPPSQREHCAPHTIRPPPQAHTSSANVEILCKLRVTPATQSGETSLPLQMKEARAGAGVGVLSLEDQEYIVLAGGYMRTGCLDSVELYAHGNPTDVSCCSCFTAPIQGPHLRLPRGRFALAETRTGKGPGVLYACGGSSGSRDLNCVEKLTREALQSWLTKTPPTPRSNRRTSRNSLSASSDSSWVQVASLTYARSALSAVVLDDLDTGPLISNPAGSFAVVGGVFDGNLVNTVEAYIPERDQWVQLPDMVERRAEAACASVHCKNLIVVAGGCSREDCGMLIEALDLRAPKWMAFPSPNPGGQGRLTGASLVTSPDHSNDLLLIGGFNGRDTIGSTWIFDVLSWQWVPGPMLCTPRANAAVVTWKARCLTAIFGGFNVAASSTGFLDTVEVVTAW